MNPFILVMGLLLAVSAPLAGLMAATPRPNAPMLVIAMPWQDPEAIIRAAGGVRIGPQTTPFAAIGQSEDPAFAARLFSFGAWSVRDASTLAQICGDLK